MSISKALRAASSVQPAARHHWNRPKPTRPMNKAATSVRSIISLLKIGSRGGRGGEEEVGLERHLAGLVVGQGVSEANSLKIQ